MQRGRGYPQSLYRFLNPDLDVRSHAPLQARFRFDFIYAGDQYGHETDWLDYQQDWVNLGYYYEEYPTSGPLVYFALSYYLADPFPGGVVPTLYLQGQDGSTDAETYQPLIQGKLWTFVAGGIQQFPFEPDSPPINIALFGATVLALSKLYH